MNWLQKNSQAVDIQQILDQDGNGIIYPQEAVQHLQGLDVCGTINSMMDSYGYLEILSRLLQCPSIMDIKPEQEQMEQPLNTEEIL